MGEAARVAFAAAVGGKLKEMQKKMKWCYSCSLKHCAHAGG